MLFLSVCIDPGRTSICI